MTYPTEYGPRMILVHLNHPCREIDVVRDVKPENEEPFRGQGYIPLAELREQYSQDE